MFILFNKFSRPYVYSLPYICLWLEEYFFKSRPVLLKDLDHFGHPLLRDAQLASFLVTSVDNNIYFGAAASSVTKKKEKKKQRQDNSINHQYFHVPYLSKVLQLTTKCQITNSQNTFTIMSLSRLRKAPGRWLESLSKWRRRGRWVSTNAVSINVNFTRAIFSLWGILR